jgi:DNA-binding transcriptional MerR regulator
MLIDPDDLDIQELADRAGLTVRTVRFYQSEGLLPAPGTRGKASRYGQAELQRLLLIKGLQERRLTLAEVRARVATLDDEGVAQQLALLGAGRSSAAAYARSVRLGRSPIADPGAGTPGDAAPTTTTWDRIALSPLIELHVRRPLSQPEQKLIEKLVALARKTLTDGALP